MLCSSDGDDGTPASRTGEKLDEKLKEIYQERKHRLAGTTARYIARDQADPEEIQIVLVWELQKTEPLIILQEAKEEIVRAQNESYFREEMKNGQ